MIYMHILLNIRALNYLCLHHPIGIEKKMINWSFGAKTTCEISLAEKVVKKNAK